MSKPHHRTCNLCEAMCGVTITTAHDPESHSERIASVKGDADDPFSRGHVCAKAIGLKTLQEDPDRLRLPMQRTAHGWREISWEEAYKAVEQGIRRVWKKHGRDAVAFYAGNPTVHSLGAMMMLAPLIASLRTRNKFSATSADQLPHMLASLEMFGHQLLLPIPDVDNTNFMLILGANPAASNGSLMTGGDIMGRIKGIQTRGGRVVVLDPRRTETAQQLGEHHFIRPGSDVYFLAALLQTLFAEKLVRLDHLAGRVTGLDELAVAVAAFSPDAVAALTGVPAEKIKALARDFAGSPRAVCYGRVGICTQEYGAAAAWLVNVLNVVTGNLDKVGGVLFTRPAVDVVGLTSVVPALRGSFNSYQSRVRGLPEFNGELPVATLAEEILAKGKGQIRALITHAGNVVLSTPNGKQVDAALADLEFMVSIDFYLNETTRHAHLILPPTGPLERSHYDLIFNAFAVRNVSKYSPPLLKSAPGAPHDWQILLELATRLGSSSSGERWLLGAIKTVVSKLEPEGILDLMLRTGPYGGLAGRPGGANRLAGTGAQQLIGLLGKLPATRGLARRLAVFVAATSASDAAQGLSLAKLKKHPHGIDLGALQPALAQRICTMDGKVALLPRIYLADLKRAQRALSSRKLKASAFVVIGRRHVRSNNSWLHNSLPLLKGKNRCTAMLHPDDAAQMKVADGDVLRVKSRVGQISLPVELCDEMMRGVVSIPHGFGHDRRGTRLSVAETRPGVSLNDITDDQRVDALSGNAAFNGTPVKLYRVVSRAK